MSEVPLGVETLDFLSRPDFEKRYLRPRIPLVLRSAMRSMPAVGRWTIEFFAQYDSSHRVPIDGCMSGIEMTLGEYCNAIASSIQADSAAGMPYMRNLPIFEHFPDLKREFEMPWISQPNWLQSPLLGDFSGGSWKYWVELFLSGPRSRFPFIHIDPYYTHAWSIQLTGTKTFWLWSPVENQLDRMLRGSLERQVPVSTQVDPTNLFPEQTCYKAVLSPGDLIFLPAGWWHITETTEPSVTLGGNFVEASNWADFREYYVARNPPHTKQQRLKRLLTSRFSGILLEKFS